MDWYCERVVNDFLVPKDEDLLDTHPSPDYWSNWGISATEGFHSPKNFFIMDFIDESFNNQIELESSPHDKDQSSSSSVCGGLPEQSFQQPTFSCDQLNYQLQHLTRSDPMNGIFLDSVPEDLPCVENLDESVNISPENQCGNKPGRLQQDNAASKFASCNSESKDCLDKEAKPVKFLDSSEQCSSRDDGTHDQSSLQEFVLKDLEMVIGQFTESTRICFRDALYRLAKNNEQQHELMNQCRDLNAQNTISQTDRNETVRSHDMKPMESETNGVDRVIANLMFNNMEFNMHGPPPGSLMNSTQQVIGSKGLNKKDSKFLNSEQKFHHLHPEKSLASADVPRFGLGNQQRETVSHISFGDPMQKSFMIGFG